MGQAGKRPQEQVGQRGVGKSAPYLGSDYLVNTYTYLWWPAEDYRDLTRARVTHAITDPDTRTALWDIWYNRDYRRYDKLTGP